MAKCGFSAFIDGETLCGASTEYPDQVHSVSLVDCTKDISRHLAVFGISEDQCINNEMTLLLSRAGKCNTACKQLYLLL